MAWFRDGPNLALTGLFGPSSRARVNGCNSDLPRVHIHAELRIYIHIGRAQYKIMDATVLISDASPDVTSNSTTATLAPFRV